MSDFIFSSRVQSEGSLAAAIRAIYHNDPPDIQEYHGSWGSLSASRNLYQGFQPFETTDHLCLVIGGPVLSFRDNAFLTGEDPVAGTRSILERWLAGKMRWEDDLSGPFIVVRVDKGTGEARWITDLLMFLPVYRHRNEASLTIASHVDALARASGESRQLDEVSSADFILHGTVTYPFTVYENLVQCHPAALHRYANGKGLADPEPYWSPVEQNPYATIDHAATALREGVRDFVGRATDGMQEVAQFISAGEDSRTVAGMLPTALKREAFVFLDSMNREGRIARRVARAYGAGFHSSFRSGPHYLEILEEASALVGLGHQYMHAHSLGFHKKCQLTRYPAVFGGYFSDSLLKAVYARTTRRIPHLPGVPDKHLAGETRTLPITAPPFSPEITEQITKRRTNHYLTVSRLRPNSAHEWFVLWPATMRYAIPNIYSNRRLLREYEPFVCNAAVKIGAAVPTEWKLNRRLFHRAFHPYLRQSKWILHPNGHLPYFPWWIGDFTSKPINRLGALASKAGMTKAHQGSWGDWHTLMKSAEWEAAVQQCLTRAELRGGITRQDAADILLSEEFSPPQKVNLLQILLSRRDTSNPSSGRLSAASDREKMTDR